MNAYDKSKVDNRNKKLMVYMERHLFNPADPISVLAFLKKFKRTCNNSVIHQGAALFLFAHFMHESAKKDLLNRMEGDSCSAIST